MRPRRWRISYVLVGWWEGMKEEHNLLSFFFAHDPNVTRDEKLLLLLTFVMSNLMGNSLLYSFQRSDPDASRADAALGQVRVAARCFRRFFRSSLTRLSSA